jgi:hypothetical protein
VQSVRQPGQPPGGAGHRSGRYHRREAGEMGGRGPHAPSGQGADRRDGGGLPPGAGRLPRATTGPGQARAGRRGCSGLGPAHGGIHRRCPGGRTSQGGGRTGPSCPLGSPVGRRTDPSTKSMSENRTFGPVLKCASVDEVFRMAPDQAAPGSGPVWGAEGSVSRAGEAHGALTPVWTRWRVPVAATAAGGMAPCPGFRGGSGTGSGFRCGDFDP